MVLLHLLFKAALSATHSFSHAPHLSKRGGGTGVLVNTKWNYAPLLPDKTHSNSFEYHAIKVTAPFKISVVVIYRPPGPLGDFVTELDTLLSSIPDLDCPLLVLGDFNIHLDKVCATDFLSLINSLDLQLVSSPPTHKNGNQLDLILTKNCKADDVMVTPLHTSDHFFIRFMVSLSELPSTPPPMVTFRRNLRNLSTTHFASVVASALPPPNTFSTRGRCCHRIPLLHTDLLPGYPVPPFHQTRTLYPALPLADRCHPLIAHHPQSCGTKMAQIQRSGRPRDLPISSSVILLLGYDC